jgi:tetratricopeptide (TPR) repeat protein
MSLTSVRLLHGNLLRSLGEIGRATQLHEDAMDACESQASFLLFASQAQMALDQFALGDLKNGEKYLHAALAHNLVGVIGPCIGLPYISRALAEWAACSGEWLTAAARIRMFLDEIQRRDLPYDRVQACYDYGCCLEGAGQLEDAEAIFLSLLPELDKSQFHRLHYQVAIALAAHYERLNYPERKQAFMISAEREKSFLQ